MANTPTRSRRSQAVTHALELKRSLISDPGFHPCQWCGREIDVDRVKNAIMRSTYPKFCGDACRRGTSQSLVVAILGAAMETSRDDNDAWRKSFAKRVALATASEKELKKA